MSEDNEEWLDDNTDHKDKVQDVKPSTRNTRDRTQKKQEQETQQPNKNEESQLWVTEEPKQHEQHNDRNTRSASAALTDNKPKVQDVVSEIIDAPKEQLQPDDPHQSFWDDSVPASKPVVQIQENVERGNRGRGNRDNRGGEQSEQPRNQGRGNRQRRTDNPNQGFQNRRNDQNQNRGDNFNRDREDRRGGFRGNFHNRREDNRQVREGQEGQQEGFRGNRNNNYNGNANRQYNNNRNGNRQYNNNRNGNRQFNNNGNRQYNNNRNANRQTNTNQQTAPNSGTNTPVTTVTTKKQQLVPKGRKAWPQSSIYIMGCHLTLTFRQIHQNPCKVLVIPYKTTKMEYYPGNLVNFSPVNYKKHIQKKGEAIQKPGSVYIQKAVQIYNFKALAFLKIDENKVGECLENGLKDLITFISGIEEPLDSIAFPICDKLGNTTEVIQAILKAMQALVQKKFKSLTEVCISTNQANCFMQAMSSFLNSVGNLIQDNQVCID